MAKEIIISPQGDLRAIYSAETEKVLRGVATGSGSKLETRRASHVEPTEELREIALAHLQDRGIVPLPGQWWADILTASGPNVLGPYPDRDTAITAEITWLAENNLPVNCGCETTNTGDYPPET